MRKARLEFRLTKENVPILKNNDIEDHVVMLLADYNPNLLDVPQALDVEHFAEAYLGLDIDYANLSFNGCYWGRMVFNNRMIHVYNPETHKYTMRPVAANTIIIDNSLLEENMEYCFRSTTAHECGHSVYHEAYYWEDDKQLSFLEKDNSAKIAPNVCRRKDIQGSGTKKLTTPEDYMEHHAKYFGAALLMNRSVMLRYYGNPEWRKNFLRNNRVFSDEHLIYEVAKTFNVSPTSAKIRIKQLGLSFEQEGFDYITIKKMNI